LKSEALDDFKASVQRIEDAADLCYKNLTILSLPKDLASWAVLTQTVARIAQTIREKGDLHDVLSDSKEQEMRSELQAAAGPASQCAALACFLRDTAISI
jgi:hypothetical protein